MLQLPEQLTPRELQEVATVVRSVGSIQRVFIFNRPRLLVIRGTEEEIASGEWVAARLTAPTTSREQDYALASHPGERLRVIFLKRDTPKQDLFELALTIRALGDVVALFTCDAAKAVVMRVTGRQAALASWLTTHLTEQRTTDSFVYGEDAVRVFYLPEPDSPVAIQETAKQIRSAIGIKRLSVYNAGRAMALRAAPTQISQVEQLLKERYP